MKNLTRLWPGSSSTLTGDKRKLKTPKSKIKLDSTTEAAPKAVRELSAIRGEGAGLYELEALTVFSQKIQAREKRGNRKGNGGSRAQGRAKEQRRRK